MKSMFELLLENDGFLNVLHRASGQTGCAALTTDKQHVRIHLGNPDGTDDRNISIAEFNREYTNYTETGASMTEVFETPFGEVLCGRCGHCLECDENGDMPVFCPECKAQLDYSFFEQTK